MAAIDTRLDELDLALINALQLSPRAPWSALAGPLGVDAATLSRRWRRMQDAGVAWVSCYPGQALAEHGIMAFVQIDCIPKDLEETATAIAEHAHASAVELVAGSHNLLLTVIATGLDALTEYVLRIGRIPAIRSMKTHLVQHLYQEGSNWRSDSLSPEQHREVAAAAPGGVFRTGPLGPEEQQLMLALGPDGRRPVIELDQELDRPESSVRRQLSALLHSGRAALRCEAALPYTGWRTTATLWLTAPPHTRAAAASAIGRQRETRMCATTVSDADLISVALFRSLDGVAEYESRLATAEPTLRVRERAVTLRWIKRAGRLLDPDGRSIGFVPMSVWESSAPVEAEPDPR